MKKLLTLLLIIIVNNYIGSAQSEPDINDILPKLAGVSNMGTDFWLTVPPGFSDEGTSGSENLVRIYVTSTAKTIVNLYASDKHFSKIAVPHEVTEFTLTPQDAQAYIKTGMTSPVKEFVAWKKGIRITSDAPIIVYVIVDYLTSGDGFIALPVSSLGTEYIVSSYGDGAAGHPFYKSLPSLAGIVATEDGTKVSFRMGGAPGSATAGGLKSGETSSETLNEGDIWIISSGIDYGDLSGSKITSDKPIAVISGNQCANVPVGMGICDYLAEMETPMSAWGKKFNIFSISGRRSCPIVRIYAKEPDTEVYRNGKLIVTLTESGGISGKAYFEARLTTDQSPGLGVISANKPIAVSLFNTGFENDGNPNPFNNPFQINLVPEEQYQDEMILYNPGKTNSIGVTENFVQLIYETDVNGEPSEAFEYAKVVDGPLKWKSIKYENSGSIVETFPQNQNGKYFSTKSIILPNSGIYKFRSPSNFSAYIYGFSGNDSYGFPAAASVRNIEKFDSLPPVPTWTTDCHGNITGEIRDEPYYMPDFRSNLSSIIYASDLSDNYDKLYVGRLVPGITPLTDWSLSVVDPTRDAKAVIRFTDAAGNDTTITIEYFAVKYSLTPSEKDFGLVKPGVDENTNFTLKNTSEKAVLHINNILLKSGKNDFRISGLGNFPKVLQPSEETNFIVNFSSAVLGKYIDSLIIVDTCSNHFAALLKAEVGGSEINVSDGDFGDFTVGQKILLKIKISNTGLTDLNITNYKGPENTDIFKIIFPGGIVINPANPLKIKPNSMPFEFYVEFSPQNTEDYKDSIVFFSDAYGIDSIAVLSGRGIRAGLLSNTVRFGPCLIDRQKFPSGPHDPIDGLIGIKLENTGTEAVTISDFSIDDDINGDAFIFDRNKLKNRIIAPLDSFIIPVQFQPVNVGFHRLIISYTNTANSKAQTVLTGSGNIPRITADAVDFGTTVIDDENDAVFKQVIIKNLSASEWQFPWPVKISELLPNPQDAISFDWSIYGAEGFKINSDDINYDIELQPGETLNIMASFLAKKEGQSEASIVINSNAEKDLLVWLKGNGIPVDVLALGDSSSLCPGNSEIITSTIKNYGSDEIIITKLQFNPAVNYLEFIDNSIKDGFRLMPDEEKEIKILFSPIHSVDRQIDLIYNTLDKDIHAPLSLLAEKIERITTVTPASQAANMGSYAHCKIDMENGTDLSPASVNNFSVTVNYNSTFLELQEDKIKIGSMIDGKFMIVGRDIDHKEGRFTISFSSITDEILNGSGTILEFSFLSFFPNEEEDVSQIIHEITIPGNDCALITANNGNIRIMPSCLNGQKFIIGTEEYSLEGTIPNPVISDADLIFSLGLKGYTLISLYDATGAHITDLVKGVMQAGRYSISLPLEELRSGLYLCRMSSGHYTASKQIVISK